MAAEVGRILGVKLLARFGFVIVDVALKIFFFIFTFQASHLLTKADFDLLSYFRSTLTMCMGALTSTVGLYFLVYARKMHGSPKYGRLYLIIPGCFFLVLLMAVSALLILGAETFKLDAAIRSMGLVNFLLAIVVASAGQVALIYSKALSRISAWTVASAVASLGGAVGIGHWLIGQGGLPGSAYYISLGYGIILLLFLRSAATGKVDGALVGEKAPRRSGWRIALVLLKRFMLPNFVETLFSILAPWLAVYALVSNSGMNGVGGVLFYQALLGLPVFLVYSLVLNDHALYRHDRSGSPEAIRRFRMVYVAFFALVTLVAGCLSAQFKRWLNLQEVSTLTLFTLFVASLLQSELIAKGMVFKKANESAKTMKHNVLYSLTLCIGAYLLTKSIGIDGYAVAVFTAWLATYVYVNVDFHRTFTMRGAVMWREVSLLSLSFGLFIHRASLHPMALALVAVGCFLAMVGACKRMMARRLA